MGYWYRGDVDGTELYIMTQRGKRPVSLWGGSGQLLIHTWDKSYSWCKNSRRVYHAAQTFGLTETKTSNLLQFSHEWSTRGKE